VSSKIPVLVTGGAGYVGSYAVLALRDSGWPVAVIDNLTTGFAFAVPSDVPFYRGDISDGDLISKIFSEQNIQAIMHFAGSIVVPDSVIAPLKYYENNTTKSLSLISAAVRAGFRHFIFLHCCNLWLTR
jgi:UDP-glucose 4-epimerase